LALGPLLKYTLRCRSPIENHTQATEGTIFNDLERSLARFQGHDTFGVECLENGAIATISEKSAVPLSMTFSAF